MPECARCGAFTDNPAEKQYHYCEDCRSRFESIRRNGIVVRQLQSGEYDVHPGSAADVSGGKEQSQVAALARGKQLSDRHGLDVLFEYEQSGSRWLLEEYLRQHPQIKQDVDERLRRAPDKTSVVDRLLSVFR